MAKRTYTDLVTNLFQAGQVDGIGSDDMRDLIESMKMPYGRAYFEGNVTESIIAAIDTFVTVAGTYINGGGEDVTTTAAGVFTYTGIPTRHFHIVSNFDMTAAANNQTVSFCWFKNSSIALPVAINQRVGTGTDVRTMSVHADVMLSTGDTLELRVANRTSTANVTCSNAYLFIMGCSYND